MRLSRVVAALAGALAVSFALSLGAGAAAAQKQKKAAPPCGISYLPLVEGTVWTYKFAVPPEVQEAPGPRSEPPETLRIEVLEVAAKGKSAEITVAEAFRGVTHETVLRCTPDGLAVPVESFFFAGEPGGGRNVALENVDAKGEVYPGKKGLGRGDELYIAVVADLVRAPTEGSGAEIPRGKLEIERLLNVGGRESVETGLGELSATRVDVVLSGRAAVEPQLDKQVHMPDTRSQLWFASGVGLVQAYNRLGHGWQLGSVTVPAK